MSSAENNSNFLFCVGYIDTKSEHKFYINYMSDSRRKKSIKLPEFMLRMSKMPGMKMGGLEEGTNVTTNKKQMEKSILGSLIGCYGQRMPKIYLTQCGEGLVMNIYIFKDHAEALRRLPLVESKNGLLRAKWQFLYSTMTIIKLRILSLLEPGNQSEGAAVPAFVFGLSPFGSRMPTGGKATTDRISLAVRLASEDMVSLDDLEEQERMKLIPSWPIRVGDKLFSFGYRDEQLQRSLYYNIVASDDPDSLRLAPFLLDIAGSASRQEACSLAKSMRYEETSMVLANHIHRSLLNYHQHHAVQVFVAKDNQWDLVVNVPLHIEHAPMLAKCFPGRVLLHSFGSCIKTYHGLHFKDRRPASSGGDIESNINLLPINNHACKETGRRATEEEIYSLLFKKVGSQPSADEAIKRMYDFVIQHDIRYFDAWDQERHLAHTIYDVRSKGASIDDK